MIGNTDFSPIAGPKNEDCCHNHTPFSGDGAVIYSIPYDFDQCGLVDAPHAAPNPRFRLRTVRQRLYRGRCINNELLPVTFEELRSKRPILEALVTEQAELTSLTRRKNAKFLDSFYRVIDNPKSVQKQISRKCIGAKR